MRILIGGSGSTGSSLLKNILSRHPDIFSGSETSLFTKRQLYLDFPKYKWRIAKRFPLGLKSHSFHMYNGVDIFYDEYRHSKASINTLITESKSFQEFADGFFHNGIVENNKKYWLEKTPGNSYVFKEFLDHFSEGQVILIVREPLEAIASMVKRGFSILYACGIYMLNNASALIVSNDRRFHIISYEELVKDPEKTITQLCKQLGIEFFPGMLSGSNTYNLRDTKIDSWDFDETTTVKEKSKSNFEALSHQDQNDIGYAMKGLRISDNGKKMFNIELSSFGELLTILGYENETLKDRKVFGNRIKQQIIIDRIIRLSRFYPTGFKYPLKLK